MSSGRTAAPQDPAQRDRGRPDEQQQFFEELKQFLNLVLAFSLILQRSLNLYLVFA